MKSRLLPALLLLFVGSGCAALIYEVVWFQLLELVIGSSAVSMGVLLGTFMGGMCLGSLLLPRVMPRDAHPLRVYALLELASASSACSCSVRHAARRRRLHRVGGRRRRRYPAARRGRAICLLPPTLLMGATLPAIARWVETTPEGVSWLGFFYGGNIAGAVVGSLLAGFYLLRVYDISIATYVAVALNVIVASLALADRVAGPPCGRRLQLAALDRRAPRSQATGSSTSSIALSGLTALAAEGDLDAPAVAAVRRDDVHVLADPRGVPGGPRHRQQRRIGARANP